MVSKPTPPTRGDHKKCPMRVRLREDGCEAYQTRESPFAMAIAESQRVTT